MKDVRYYYFAYGSNMSHRRMRERINGAIEVGTGVLHNWNVVERLYADIEPCRGKRVYGVVYALTAKQLFVLDGYEGFPNVYGERILPIKMSDGNRVSAITYVMAPRTAQERDGKAYPTEYRDICSEGAREHFLRDCFKVSTKEVA